jgi:hypothetical protein
VSAQRDTALFSAMAYGLLAAVGSVDYYRWGGLPNLIGMSFFLECLIVLTERKPAFRENALFGLTFTAIFFTHHHVMLTSGLTFAVCFFWLDDRQRAKAILYGLLISLGIGSFYIVPYAIKVSALGDTSILTFQETLCTPWCIYDSMGAIFSEMVCLGVFAYVIEAVLRKKESQFDPLFLVTVGTIAVLYILFEYVFRGISLFFSGKEYAAFTPSRFLTDLVYFLAIFAGYSVGFVRRRLPIPASAGVSLAALALLLVAHSDEAPFYAKKTDPNDPGVTEDRYAALDWISNHTPTNTIVMDGGNFTPYIAWRRSFGTPMPVSEPRISSNRLGSEEIARLRLSGDNSSEARAWELISVGPASSAGPGDKVVYQSNLEAVIVKKWPE